MKHFLFDKPFVEERIPDIGDTVILVYAEWTNQEPIMGIYVSQGNGYRKIFTPTRMILWDNLSPIYVINKGHI